MAERNIAPNLEAEALNGNPVFTPSQQWLERSWEITKRKNRIDKAMLLKSEDVTEEQL